MQYYEITYFCSSTVKKSFYVHFRIFYMIALVHEVGTAPFAVSFAFCNSLFAQHLISVEECSYTVGSFE